MGPKKKGGSKAKKVSKKKEDSPAIIESGKYKLRF